MAWVIYALLIIPLVACATSWFAPVAARLATVGSGIASLGISLVVIPSSTAGAAGQWLRIDSLSAVFLITVTFVYAATTMFAAGYVGSSLGQTYSRRFFAGFNLFAWSMILVPLVNNFALLWVAIEVTTVVSALLVALDDTDGSTEAAWKYVLIASLGLGIALLGTVVLYYAGTAVLGDHYQPYFPSLLNAASSLPHEAVRLSFVLAVLGFGTKMGLAPVHTWLPDAHSEAPTPVSAMLSGALLAVSFYAILRFFQVAVATLGPTFPRDVLLAFGLASLLLAALYVASQRDLKRLLAYSSIEHMGVLAIGMSFSAPIAIVGVLLHVLAHACAKGSAFFGAGSMLRKFGTKDMGKLRGGISALPWTGSMLLLAVLALSALPPFGIFRSEFLIVSGGLQSSSTTVPAVLVILVTLATFGLTWSTTETLLTPPPVGVAPGETTPWFGIAMAFSLLALLVLGIHPPGQLSDLLHRAASELAGGT
jgi:hydrogenase-4 component F